ncbi:methyltransferase [Sphingomonas sp. S1-29]|uniref:class I SAM-dependent methyltransferase n=1 Tax=Sphingomonas sp. S1-29 TaxID=2991074 RepID=UPI00223FD278|nr:methyltransferase [Sphingomonas sp. S1-29]UZK68504.1 methyltransferase [Sphingomonas sp. S1-29]
MTPVTTTPSSRAARRSDATPSPWGMFLRGFIKHPVMVGSIMPSSKRLMDRMLDRVDWSATKLFVEYGPGTGNFCQAVLDRLAPDATLLAIDTNIDFVRYLRQTIRDPRFVVVHGSAADVRQIIADHGHAHADYVLSGLPFSTLPPGVGDAIGLATRDVVRPGGAFLVYQFSTKCRDFFDAHFGRIDHEMEWWNVPPAQLYWAWADDAPCEVELAA